MGRSGDQETAGGGRILILTDSLNLNGFGKKLQANGLPL
jgi:hypothetical protein